jgi:GATA-binding protein
MNAFAYDNLSVSSDGSVPRTPSPGSSHHFDDQISFPMSSSMGFDSVFNADSVPSASTFTNDYSLGPPRHYAAVDIPPSWQNHAHGAPMLQPVQGPGRASLLQELYDHELPPEHLPHSNGHHPHDTYYQHSAEPHYQNGGADWSNMTPPSSSNGLPGSPHVPPPMRAPHDSMVRRNTFPYVRHDHEANGNGHYAPHPPPHYVDHPQMMPPFGRPDMVYGEPMPMNGHMPLSAEPSALHGSRMEDGFGGHMHPDERHHQPHHPYHPMHHDGSVKLEEGGPVMIPSHGGFYRPPSSGGMMPYLSPHTGLPIQHTDDAASKETQYLRRRCFNCHTTEPPSWRRSTLNPGKIVCNKCGLYERTHLRPRPLRFDELRAGNKARKAAAAKTTTGSPKQRPMKKDSGDTIARRASVSSNSSVGASSDWDDGASVYSTGSSSSFNSPATSTFSIPRDSASASPPMGNAESGIRLPTGGLNDIASMPPMRDSAHMPHKSASGPAAYYPSYQSDVHSGGRRNTVNLPLGASAPVSADALRRPLSSHGEASVPEQWSGVPAEDVTPTQGPTASPKPLAVA